MHSPPRFHVDYGPGVQTSISGLKLDFSASIPALICCREAWCVERLICLIVAPLSRAELQMEAGEYHTLVALKLSVALLVAPVVVNMSQL